MSSMYLARRIRTLVRERPECAGFVEGGSGHGEWCARCGQEELVHIARAAADVIDPPPRELRGRRSTEVSTDDGSIDIANAQLVALQGDNLVVMNPRTVMRRQQALIHAAWIVAIAEVDAGEFARILDVVRSA